MTTSLTGPAGASSEPGPGPGQAGAVPSGNSPCRLGRPGRGRIVVRIRPIRPDDEGPLKAMNQRLSDRSVYLRFFSLSRRGADEHAHHLAAAGDGHQALVAEAAGRVIGVASYEVMDADQAEMAFLLTTRCMAGGSERCCWSSSLPSPARPASAASAPRPWRRTRRCCASSPTRASSRSTGSTAVWSS